MTSFNKQRSRGWFAERAGKFTASQLWRLLDPKERDAYIREVVAERLGTSAPKESSFAKRWGIRYEPVAKTLFQQQTGCKLIECGFLQAKDPALAGWFGASPDAIEETHSFGVEIKCLSKSTHKRIDISRMIPWKHGIQVASQMLATGIPSWVYVCYNPGVPVNPLFWISVTWSEMSQTIEDVRSAVLEAIEEASKLLAQMRGQ